MRLITPHLGVVHCKRLFMADELPSSPNLRRSQSGCEVSKADSKARQKGASRKAGSFSANTAIRRPLRHYEQADQLVNHNINYSTAKEVLRQQRITGPPDLGNQDVTDNPGRSLAEFRTAIQRSDPTNDLTLQRFKDSWRLDPARSLSPHG